MKSISYHIRQRLPKEFKFVDSEEDLKPPQFFHYTQPMRRMMKRMGYDLHRGDDLNFEKGRRIHLQPLMLKEKLLNYYDQTSMGLGYVTPSTLSELETDDSLLYHHIL